MEYLPAIISALGTVIAAWFAYNQYSKNKLTDLKIENWKKEEELKCTTRSDNVAKIYGQLWQLLHSLEADRVYIVQPHPLTNNLFLSVGLEVKRNGISPMKQIIQNMQMCNVASFSSELSIRDFMFYRNIEDVKDKRAKAIFLANGSVSAIIKRLSNEKDEWIGSVFCEFTKDVDLQPVFTKKELLDVADIIQYILPEYK